MEKKEIAESLDRFQQVLEDGLIKVCSMSGTSVRILESQDIEGKWNLLIKDYMADAVENINDYPEAAIGFAFYLGMAVANWWDRDWKFYKDKSYKSYCGDRGFDDMDDHIMNDILHSTPEMSLKISSTVMNCAQSAFDLIRYEGIDLQSEYGFYVLVRCCTAMYRIGASTELCRLGYRMERMGV